VRAPMNGRIAEVRAKVGDAVEAGQVLIVLEAMKLQHNLSAPRAGVVARVDASVGAQAAPGQILVALE
jgi:biotin carboxyl carrier protein